MKKYVLYSKIQNGYYSGKCYQCKNANDDVSAYPIFLESREKAKKYSSFKRAENFIKKFSEKNPFDYEWSIKEVEE